MFSEWQIPREPVTSINKRLCPEGRLGQTGISPNFLQLCPSEGWSRLHQTRLQAKEGVGTAQGTEAGLFPWGGARLQRQGGGVRSILSCLPGMDQQVSFSEQEKQRERETEGQKATLPPPSQPSPLAGTTCAPPIIAWRCLEGKAEFRVVSGLPSSHSQSAPMKTWETGRRRMGPFSHIKAPPHLHHIPSPTPPPRRNQ